MLNSQRSILSAIALAPLCLSVLAARAEGAAPKKPCCPVPSGRAEVLPTDLGTFTSRIFDTSDFPPRWYCGTWTSGHGWLHICSDAAIFLAYMAIPCALIFFVRKRKDIPFPFLFYLFGAFIVACGVTHLMEAIIFWWPAYRFAGVLKLTTALISLTTVVALAPQIPKLLQLKGPKELENVIRRRTDELRQLTETDELTGLSSRKVLEQCLQDAIDHHDRQSDHVFALLFLDFDRFKNINDSLGHDVGDQLLIAIADRLRGRTRRGDVVARFGGDEFVILSEGLHSDDEAYAAANRLEKSLEEPYGLAGQQLICTASIGVVTSSIGANCAKDVLRDADAAMYAAKGGGRGCVRMFDREMHEHAVRRLQMETSLRNADFDKEFRLEYQPIVDLQHDRLSGFEALVRWEHPERGRLMPDEFIELAEETGVIVDLGEWVLRTACTQLARWRATYEVGDSIRLSVNVSRQQLVHPAFVEQVRAALRSTGVPPRQVVLEVTENTIMHNRSDVMPTLNAVRELGLHLAMDDFGTGHSSLSCLHRFPLSFLKIDRSFITNLQEQRRYTAVIHSILSLATNLEMPVVAEGIENFDQLAQLQTLECAYGQGYLFSKPIPPEEVAAHLSETGVSPWWHTRPAAVAAAD